MVMSQLAGRPAGTNLVCNGFKDSEYMELVRCLQGPGAEGRRRACRRRQRVVPPLQSVDETCASF